MTRQAALVLSACTCATVLLLLALARQGALRKAAAIHETAAQRALTGQLLDKIREMKRPALTTSPAAGSSKPSVPASALNLGAVFARSPELSSRFVRARQARLAITYGPFIRRQRLSPKMADAFLGALRANLARDQDIYDSSQSLGLDAQAPEITSLLAASSDQEKADERAALGDDDYAALLTYQHSLPIRGMIGGLAAAVAETSPLTADQAEQLTEAIAQTAAQSPTGSFADPATVDWQAADVAAQRILNPAQYVQWQSTDLRDPLSGWSRADYQLQALYNRAKAADRAQATP